MSTKGMVPWNKGLTKETSEIVKLNSEKSKKAIRKLIKEGEIISSMLGKKHTKQAVKKMSKAKLKNPTRYWLGKHRSEETKQKIRESVSKAIQKGCFKLKPTKPELFLIDLFNKNSLFFKYVGDGKFWIDYFNPDFINFKDKQIIEFFGDYWHNKPEAIKRDKLRLQAYNKNGFKTIIIWGSDLKSKEDKEILEMIKERAE